MKENKPLTSREKRLARKAKRGAPRKLLATIEGQPIDENAEARIIRCGNSHRASETKAEAAFHRIAEGISSVTGLQLRLQEPVAFSSELFFVIDFFFPLARVGVEIDGPEHNRECAKQKDIWRDDRLLKKGIRVVRFTNADVCECPEKVGILLVAFLAEHGSKRGRQCLQANLSHGWKAEVGGGQRPPTALP